jgi:drug/metabolite transporter (DMT)-like permease
MNAERLTLAQIAMLVAYAIGMAGGQFLFKFAALRTPGGAIPERLGALMQDVVFLAALALYAVLAFLWVWILTFTPLSRAYPFVAIAFAVTPLLGGFIFGEPLTLRLFVGIAIIFAGLIVVVS